MLCSLLFRVTADINPMDKYNRLLTALNVVKLARDSLGEIEMILKDMRSLADQATLLLMLYSGAIKFLKLAAKAIDDNDVEETNYQLGRVQDILCELMGSLNPDVPEMSGNLFQLYEYMHHQLVQANI